MNSPDLTHDYWRRQGLARDRDGALDGLLAEVGGLSGTSPTCYLSLIARKAGFLRSDLDRALYDERTLVRVRAMRGSLYMLPVEKAPLLLAATARQSMRGFKAIVDKQIGPARYGEIVDRVLVMLDDGPLPAAEIRKRLDLADTSEADAIKYVIAWMAAQGIVVRATVQGGWRSDRFTYARWEDWVGSPLELPGEAESMVELAKWYQRGYGPATADDFRWWSGLTVREALAAMDGIQPPVVEPGPSAVGVRLLPVWDTALIGHVDRRRIVPDEWTQHVYDRSGNATSVVVADGRAAGLWQLDGQEKLTIRAAPFTEFAASTRDSIAGEAETIARALGAGLEGVEFVELPPPLQTAPRNRFLAPLGG